MPVNRGPGLAQAGAAWQDVTGSRTPGTVYQNTSGKPIMVAITRNSPWGGVTTIAYCGAANPPTVPVGAATETNATGTYNTGAISFVVPVGHYYRVDGAPAAWAELK